MTGKYKNRIEQVGTSNNEDRMYSVVTEPKVAIGQRCIMIQTGEGNVLWDCITYLDQDTVDFIMRMGGLKAIVISHPHYYSTHLDWAKTFECPVYMAKDDEEWLNRVDRDGCRKFLTSTSEQMLNGVTAIKTGGHFPGSLVLLWRAKLLIADTFVTVPVDLSQLCGRVLC